MPENMFNFQVTRRTALGLALSGSLTAILAACSSTDNSSQPTTGAPPTGGTGGSTSSGSASSASTPSNPPSSSGGTHSKDIKIAITSFGNQTLDPATQDGTSVDTFIIPLYDSLVEIDDTGKIAPGLAQSWSMSDDKTVWTFKLRADAEFHNGNGILTAADAKFSLERMMNDKTTASVGGLLQSMIKSVDAPDATTLVITTNGVQQTLVNEFTPSEGGGLVLPMKYLTDKAGTDFDAQSNLLTTAPIGSGPFQFDSMDAGQSITFKAVPKHWRNTPQIASVQFLNIPDASTQLSMLQSAQADVIQAAPDSAKQITGAGMEVRQIKGAQDVGMMFNGTWRPVAATKPTSKADVRHALSLAIDRQTLIDTIIDGYATLPTMPYATSEATAEMDPKTMAPLMQEYNEYNPDKAKTLLAQAGYPNGFDTGFQIYSFARSTTPFAPSLIEAIVAQWAAIGVTAKIVPVDYTTWRPHFLNAPDNDPYNAADAAVYGITPRLDPGSMLVDEYSSYGKSAQLAGTALDPLIKKIQGETDVATRTADVTTAMTNVKDLWVTLPLFTGDVLFGVNPQTVGQWKTQQGFGFLGRIVETIQA